MTTTTRQITVRHLVHEIVTDGYGAKLGERFEPHTVAIMEALADPDSRVLDIGANIGITGLALSQIVPQGRVAAIEPVPATYRLLAANMRLAQASNVSTHNFALGKEPGEAVMQGNPDNASGSFVTDARYRVEMGSHFREKVQVLRLDDAFPMLDLDRLDMIKIDVEGFELNVLDGALELLAKYKPRVFLEMNHIALSMWHGIALPEFLKRLLAIFPCVYAYGEDGIFDLTDEAQGTRVLYAHLNTFKYTDIIAGFDRVDLEERLARVNAILMRNERIATERQSGAEALRERVEALSIELEQSAGALRQTQQTLREALADRDAAVAELNQTRSELHSIWKSKSWKVTEPLRKARRMIGR